MRPISDCVKGLDGGERRCTPSAIANVIPKFMVAGNLATIGRCLRFLAAPFCVVTCVTSVMAIGGPITSCHKQTHPIITAALWDKPLAAACGAPRRHGPCRCTRGLLAQHRAATFRG